MLDEILKIIINGVITILGALGSYGITVIVTYLKKKKEALIQQIGDEKYNANYKIAKEIYYIVEEKFRFLTSTSEEKIKEFDKLLLEKIPQLEQKDLDHLRQTICGEINDEVKKSQILAPAFDDKIDIADIIEIKQNN
jgi:hypothetical protein